MKASKTLRTPSVRLLSVQHALIAFAAVGGIVASTGCQVHVAGQTLPSGYYLMDDIQYFPAGSENKLANETAALKADREAARSRR
jgi:hypothetical protein